MRNCDHNPDHDTLRQQLDNIVFLYKNINDNCPEKADATQIQTYDPRKILIRNPVEEKSQPRHPEHSREEVPKGLYTSIRNWYVLRGVI